MELKDGLDILERVSTDLWIEVYSYLGVIQIVRLGEVCRLFNELSKLRPIWVNAIASHIYGQNLQLPGRNPNTPLTAYDTPLLRDMAVRAVKVAFNLGFVSPRPTEEVEVLCNDHDDPVRGVGGRRLGASHVAFLNGYDGSRWLLGVASVTGARSRISCWEILRAPLTTRLAYEWEIEGTVLHLVHDKDAHAQGLVSVTVGGLDPLAQTCRTLILSVDGLESGGTPTFTISRDLESTNGRVHLVRNGRVVLWYPRSRMCTVLDLKTGVSQALHSDATNDNDDSVGGSREADECLAVDLSSNALLIVVTTTFIRVWRLDGNASSTDDVTEPSSWSWSWSSTPLYPEYVSATTTGLLSACIVPHPRPFPTLHDDQLTSREQDDGGECAGSGAEAAFSIVQSTRGYMGTEQLECDYLEVRRRRPTKATPPVSPPPNTTPDSPGSPAHRVYQMRRLIHKAALYSCIRGMSFAPSGRGVAVDALTCHLVMSGDWTSTLRLILLDVVQRYPGGSADGDEVVAHRQSLNPSRQAVGPPLLRQGQLKVACLDYDDAEGRVVIATSGTNALLKILQY